MFTTEVLESEIVKITEGVFSTMLGIEVRTSTPVEAPTEATTMMTGVVTVTGTWSGAITVTCALEFAKHIACTMFGTDPGATTHAEISDAMGEMANMIGGNFKSLLPPPASLSLPSVTQGRQYEVNLPGCEEAGRFVFLANDSSVTVTVLEHS